MWFKLKEGETVQATIDFTSIKSVAKHWTGSRSELCLGQGCRHCLNNIPKRWRYQVTLLIARVAVSWEVGEQAMVELNNISHVTNWAHITITRLGMGRDTRYQISQSEAKPEEIQPALPVVNKYTRGKYGKLEALKEIRAIT